MLYRKLNVSTRTLLKLTSALTILVSGVGSALAATNSGVAPVLVPYVVQSIAGNTQPTTAGPTSAPTSGYGGDGQLAISPTQTPTVNTSTFNGPQAIITDSVGNVYIADTANAVIREINKNTGIINTVAGKPPSNCTSGTTTCSKINNGCADAVPAAGAPIGTKVMGLVVDGYGNLYFSDLTTETISIVYRGGTQVANFIKQVNPAGVARSGGVQPGYLYHVAGSVNLQTCVAALIKTSDNLPAFGDTSSSTYVAAVNTVTPPIISNAASLNMSGFSQIGVDSAGNIYVGDISNGVIRVINTQSTPQIFFNSLVLPGYMASVVNCSAFTATCPSVITTTTGTGIGGPADVAAFTTMVGMSTDAYGNVYEINYKGASPGIFAGVAYAGGSAIAQLQSAEWGITASYGNFYEVINNIAVNTSLPNVYEGVVASCCGAASGGGGVAIRPNSIVADPNGTLWFWDQHYPSIFRVDPVNAITTTLIGWGGTQQFANPTFMRGSNGITTSPAAYPTWVKQQYCVYGTTASPFTQGPQTYDRFGDNCPAVLGDVNESETGIVVSDGPGNLFFTDTNNQIIREFPLDNVFAATAVGTPVTQPIQVHFDATNNPAVVGASPNLFTNAFSIPGSDFSIDTTDPEFQLGTLGWYGYEYTPGPTSSGSPLSTTVGTPAATLAMYSGIPSCFQFGTPSNNLSLDCLVYVTFKPSQAGLRESQLVATTKNGSVYNFPLYGVGSGGQLAIDGGQQVVSATTGLGKATAVAVTTGGTMYIADPDNNRIVVEPSGGGTQTVIGPTVNLFVPVSKPSNYSTTATSGLSQIAALNNLTLSGPKGVAVDAANNVYISDTGNNRILKYNPGSQIATVIGQTVWTSCTSPAASTLTASTAGSVPTVIAPVAPTSTISIAGSPVPQVSGCTASGNTVGEYIFNGPQGLAVDSSGNVYVADTGNGVVVELPSNPVLGGAIPLLNYLGAPTLTAPTAVAVGPFLNQSTGVFYQDYVYIADPQNPSGFVVVLPPGGGDLQTVPGTAVPGLGLFGPGPVGSPNGVAVDGGGNLYISDSLNNQVVEVPAGGASTGPQFALNFTSLNTPGGVAVDQNGAVYVADTQNSRVLVEFRQNPIVQFGTVPQFLGASGVAGTPLVNGQPCPVAGVAQACTGVLTLTNTGTSVLSLNHTVATPLITIVGTQNPAFSFATNCGATLPAGGTCTISPTFTPTSNGSQSENVDVNSTNSMALVANQAVGELPLANLVLTTSVGSTPAIGAVPVITATVTQTHPTTVIPTGTVTFTYVIDTEGSLAVYAGNCGAGGTSGPVLLVNGVATYTMPATLAGRQYVVTATYSGDGSSSFTRSSNQVLMQTQLIANISPVAASASFTYGSKPPTLTGTVTGILPADQSTVTYTFVSAASTTSGVTAPTNLAVPAYPIQVVFQGGNYCNYGSPTVMTAATGGVPSTVTENPTPLTVGFSGPYSTVYGAPNLNFSSLLTLSGAVNGDQKRFLATFLASNGTISSSQSSLLPVGTYLLTPSLTASNVALVLNYTVTTKPGTVTVSQAPPTIAVALASGGQSLASAYAASGSTAETVANVAKAVYTATVQTAVGGGNTNLLPTGTVTVYDTFIPITFPTSIPSPPSAATALGIGTTVPSCTLPLTATITAPFQGTTTANSQIVTTAFPVSGLVAGETVTGSGIPANTTVLSIGSTVAFLGATTTGSTTVTLISNVPGLVSGETVSGSGILSGTTIASVGSGTLTLSQAATLTSSSTSFTATSAVPGSIITLSAAATATNALEPISVPMLAGVSSTYGLFPGESLSGTGIPSGTTVFAIGVGGLVNLSASPTANNPAAIITATVNTTTCNQPVGTITLGTSTSATPGGGTFTPSPSAAPFNMIGTNQLLFAYSGDGNYLPSVQPISIVASAACLPNNLVVPGSVTPSTCLLVDNPDFYISIPYANQGLQYISPGGNTTYTVTVSSLIAQTGVVNFSCLPIGNPYSNPVVPPPTGATSLPLSPSSYIQCALSPNPSLSLAAGGTTSATLTVSTPLSEPLGFNFYSMVPTKGSATMATLLPLGILAFCMRRRRRLSKALWMLLAIAVVSVGMSGCGGNTVSFYSPIPIGPQYVTVYATGNSITGNTPLLRSLTVNIDLL